MKQIYVVEDLCNGCRLCQTFCSSLGRSVFDYDSKDVRIQVIKVPGELRDIPVVNCNGRCVKPLFEEDCPTCVSVCPTGALLYEEQQSVIVKRLELEKARKCHSLFKVVAPWKWPFPWKRKAWGE